MGEKETKLCKHCQMEIPKKAKVCPNCKKKVKGGVLKWVIIAIIAIAVIGALAGGGDDGSSKEDTNAQTNESVSAKDEKEETEITYKKYEVGKLVEDLENNALKASDTYKDQYVKLTGVVGTIDSSGDYICVNASGGDFSMYNVQCFINNEEQKKAIMELSDGESVVVKGKITDVGEVMGYSLSLDSIKKAK